MLNTKQLSMDIKYVSDRCREFRNWKIVSWYCPNCGQLIGGIPNAEGKIKTSCCKCKTEMVFRNKGRRHDTLELFAPQ